MIGDILQPTHLLFILVIALLVLGPKRLPEVGRSLGRGLRDFRNAMSGFEHSDDEVGLQASAPPAGAVAGPPVDASAPAASVVAEPPTNASAPPPAPVHEPAAEPAPEQPAAEQEAAEPVPEPAGAPAEPLG